MDCTSAQRRGHRLLKAISEVGDFIVIFMRYGHKHHKESFPPYLSVVWLSENMTSLQFYYSEDVNSCIFF
jgi:hypothetical protein